MSENTPAADRSADPAAASSRGVADTPSSSGATSPAPRGGAADTPSSHEAAASASRGGATASPLDTVAPDSTRPTESTVRIGLVLPDVMGTYGDDGNSLILRQRLRWRVYVIDQPA